jgi:hypothetical protein
MGENRIHLLLRGAQSNVGKGIDKGSGDKQKENWTILLKPPFSSLIPGLS